MHLKISFYLVKGAVKIAYFEKEKFVFTLCKLNKYRQFDAEFFPAHFTLSPLLQHLHLFFQRKINYFVIYYAKLKFYNAKPDKMSTFLFSKNFCTHTWQE
jgi:hypothetical protein